MLRAFSHRVTPLLLSASLGIGCRRDPPPEPAAAVSVPLEASDPDLLTEGNLQVFGLRLPVGSKVRGETSSAASIVVPHPTPRVTEYLERHLRDVAAEASPGDGKVLVGSPLGAGSAPLRLVVSRTGAGTAILLSVEPPPPDRAISTRVEFASDRPFSAPAKE